MRLDTRKKPYRYIADDGMAFVEQSLEKCIPTYTTKVVYIPHIMTEDQFKRMYREVPEKTC